MRGKRQAEGQVGLGQIGLVAGRGSSVVLTRGNERLNAAKETRKNFDVNMRKMRERWRTGPSFARTTAIKDSRSSSSHGHDSTPQSGLAALVAGVLPPNGSHDSGGCCWGQGPHLATPHGDVTGECQNMWLTMFVHILQRRATTRVPGMEFIKEVFLVFASAVYRHKPSEPEALIQGTKNR